MRISSQAIIYTISDRFSQTQRASTELNDLLGFQTDSFGKMPSVLSSALDHIYGLVYALGRRYEGRLLFHHNGKCGCGMILIFTPLFSPLWPLK
ncbi:hypothetical protein RJ60_11380 [Mesotoga sp. B105.6.4]|nr:hypothetical protein RJ60_11380 [Mesotoga sp. B105.6.4]